MNCTEESFLKDVAEHCMTVIRDDGVHRHLHFAIPGSGNMHFNIVTWPHYLCYSGDMGCYVFSRIDDMFQFFRPRSDAASLRINTGYWSEKLEASDRADGHREYSADKFRKRVNDWLDEREADDELREAVKEYVLDYADDGDFRAHQALDEFEHEGRRQFTDTWECDFAEYTDRFVWCCYALVWAIRQYDQARAA